MAAPRNKSEGFSLIEVLLALGIAASALLILVGLITHIMDTSRASQIESVAALISSQVRTRLLTNPNWPPNTENRSLAKTVDAAGIPDNSFSWDQLYLDEHGVEIPLSEKDRAVFQGVLTFRRSPHYNSARLDFVTLAIRDVQRDEIVAEFTYQRARKKARPER
ncbi:MAG: hypothetical protein ACI9TH_001932 [Kiritimatiellia bacterium]|jgi:uncharacterized protein (TIGR02598 family)